MTKQEFQKQLEKNLAKLPPDEIASAVQYYEDYFIDAGITDEMQLPPTTLSPAAAAAAILDDMVEQYDKDDMKKGMKTMWIVLLSVFALPIGLPLAIAAFAIAFAVLMVVFACLFSVWVCAVSTVFAGAVCAIMGICLLFQDLMTGLFFAGLGLISFSLGMLLCKFSVFITKKTCKLTADSFSKMLKRRVNA